MFDKIKAFVSGVLAGLVANWKKTVTGLAIAVGSFLALAYVIPLLLGVKLVALAGAAAVAIVFWKSGLLDKVTPK